MTGSQPERSEWPSILRVVGAAIIAALFVLALDLLAPGPRTGNPGYTHLGDGGGVVLLGYVTLVAAALGTGGLVALVSCGVSARVTTRPRAKSALFAFALVVPLAPLLVRSMVLLFRGGKMRQWAFGGLGPAVAGTLAVLAAAGAAAVLVELVRRVRGHRTAERGLALVLVAVAMLGHRMDGTVYPGLYDHLHTLLIVGSYTAALVAMLVPAASRSAPPLRIAGILLLGGLAAAGTAHVLTFQDATPPSRRLLVQDLQTPSTLIALIPYPLHDHSRTQETVAIPGWLARQPRLRDAVRTKLEGLRPQRPLNVVIVSIDALRADHCSFLGYRRQTTPFLEELAKRSFVFTRAWTSAPTSSIACRTILSGISASTLVARGGAEPVTLATHLRAHGYRAGAVFDRIILGEAPDPSNTLGFEAVAHDANAAQAVGKLLAMIEATRREAFCVWGHLMDPHAPYAKHAAHDFGDAPADRYDSEIAYVDSELRRLWRGLERLGLLDQTLVVVTADHGEAFGEHGRRFHGTDVYDPQCRVPLLIRVPFLEDRARRIEVPVTINAVAGTITDLLGLPAAPDDETPSLAPLVLDLDDGGDAFCVVERFSSHEIPGWRSLRAIVRPPYKLIRNLNYGTLELYDLLSDPGETDDLCASHPDTLAALARLEQGWIHWIRLRRGDTARTDLPAEYLSVRQAFMVQDARAISELRRWIHHAREDVRRDAAMLVFQFTMNQLETHGADLLADAGQRGTDAYVRSLHQLVLAMIGRGDLDRDSLGALASLPEEQRTRAFQQLLQREEPFDDVAPIRAFADSATAGDFRPEVLGLLATQGDASVAGELLRTLESVSGPRRVLLLHALLHLDDGIVWPALERWCATAGQTEFSALVLNAELLLTPPRLELLSRWWLLAAPHARAKIVEAFCVPTATPARTQLLSEIVVHDPLNSARLAAARGLTAVPGETSFRALLRSFTIHRESASAMGQALLERTATLVDIEGTRIDPTPRRADSAGGVPLFDIATWKRLAGSGAKAVRLHASLSGSGRARAFIIRDGAGRERARLPLGTGVRAVTVDVAVRGVSPPLVASLDPSPGTTWQIDSLVASRVNSPSETWPRNLAKPHDPWVLSRFDGPWTLRMTGPNTVWLAGSRGRYRFPARGRRPRSVRLTCHAETARRSLTLRLNGVRLLDRELVTGENVLTATVPTTAWSAAPQGELELQLRGTGGMLGVSEIIWLED